MKFKEGSGVEVLRKEKDAHGYWYRAEILSRVGNVYTVRYELSLSNKGEGVVEKVHEEDIRPCPLPRGGESWAVGDIAEVFDLWCWKVGKIAKVLSNGYVVAKLLGSIELKKFHVSHIRVRQAWQNNRWISLGKVSAKENLHTSSKYTTCMDSGADGVKCSEAYIRQKCNQDSVCASRSERTLNKHLSFHDCSNHDAAALKERGNKRRWIVEASQYNPLTKRAMPTEVDASSFPHELVGKNCMPSSTTPLPIVQENIECSVVASCSGNDLAEYTQDTRTTKYCREISGNILDETTSSLAPNSGQSRTDVCEGKLAANIHELELRAYKSTVQALYASGPLTWEQESLLTNLRMSLHISNEEHLLQLRDLLSA